MADYFTKFSIVVHLPSTEARDYALELHAQVNEDDEIPKDFPEALLPVTWDWSFDVDANDADGKPGIWLSSIYGGIDAVCLFIQHLLQKFDPQGKVAFQWACDCSKPRTDAYGGGGAIVTATDIKMFATGDWLEANAR